MYLHNDSMGSFSNLGQPFEHINHRVAPHMNTRAGNVHASSSLRVGLVVSGILCMLGGLGILIYCAVDTAKVTMPHGMKTKKSFTTAGVHLTPTTSAFLTKLKKHLHPVGVLGSQNNRTCPVLANTCIVDPAGLNYMKTTLANAGGASGAIYKHFGLTVAADEVKQSFIQKNQDGHAKFHLYTQGEMPRYTGPTPVGIIHAVGPSSGDLNQFLAKLQETYKMILKEFVSAVVCTELRLLPISMGIFAHASIGKDKDKIADATITALASAVSAGVKDGWLTEQALSARPVGMYLHDGSVAEFTSAIDRILLYSEVSDPASVSTGLPACYVHAAVAPHDATRVCNLFRPTFATHYASALAEMIAGTKTSHWAWYFMPTGPYLDQQNRRIGSQRSQTYELSSDSEVLAYLTCEVLPQQNGRYAYMGLLRNIYRHLSQGRTIDSIIGIDVSRLNASVRLLHNVADTIQDGELKMLCWMLMRIIECPNYF